MFFYWWSYREYHENYEKNNIQCECFYAGSNSEAESTSLVFAHFAFAHADRSSFCFWNVSYFC